jgi:inorganic pyrophosphatase
MEKHVYAFIEIEKGSNIKFELNKQTNTLEVDRMLPQPHVYPYSYGFIPNTLAEDGDELDILIVSDTRFGNNHTMTAYIIGALLMEDEKGTDDKILAVCDNDYFYGNKRNLTDLSSDQLESIQTFFANYKLNEPGKWSKVHGFVDRTYAYEIYQRSLRATETKTSECCYYG